MDTVEVDRYKGTNKTNHLQILRKHMYSKVRLFYFREEWMEGQYKISHVELGKTKATVS